MVLRYTITTEVSWIQLWFNGKVICEHSQPSDPIIAAANSLIMTVRRCPMAEINHRSMHLLRSHQRQREKTGRRIDMILQQRNRHCTGECRGLLSRSAEWPKLEGNSSGANDEMGIYRGNGLNWCAQNKKACLSACMTCHWHSDAQVLWVEFLVGMTTTGWLQSEHY